MANPSTIVGNILLFVLSWIIISLVIYFTSKFFSRGSTLSKAFLASLAGLVVFLLLDGISSLFLKSPLPQVIGFVGLLWVFKTVFNVGWLGALGIAVLSAVFLVVINFILFLLGIGLHLLHV